MILLYSLYDIVQEGIERVLFDQFQLVFGQQDLFYLLLEGGLFVFVIFECFHYCVLLSQDIDQVALQ